MVARSLSNSSTIAAFMSAVLDPEETWSQRAWWRALYEA
jgi:hypothetical protein